MAEQEKPKVYDLDVLRPEPVMIRLLDEEIDISFIPSGVAMDIEHLQNKLTVLQDGRDPSELTQDADYALESMEVMTAIVLKVAQGRTSWTKERLMRETTIEQLQGLITLTFRHMYGPRSKEIIDAELAKVEEAQEAGDGEQPKPKKRGAETPNGQKPLPSRASSMDGSPTTAKPF